MNKLISDFTIEDILIELSKRGNTFAAVAEAQLLVLKKSEDYNSGSKLIDSKSAIARDIYFPFGLQSYVHMIHTKSLRLVSLVGQHKSNFEGIKDTALDLINYGSFLVEKMNREELEVK